MAQDASPRKAIGRTLLPKGVRARVGKTKVGARARCAPFAGERQEARGWRLPPLHASRASSGPIAAARDGDGLRQLTVSQYPQKKCRRSHQANRRVATRWLSTMPCRRRGAPKSDIAVGRLGHARMSRSVDLGAARVVERRHGLPIWTTCRRSSTCIEAATEPTPSWLVSTACTSDKPLIRHDFVATPSPGNGRRKRGAFYGRSAYLGPCPAEKNSGASGVG